MCTLIQLRRLYSKIPARRDIQDPGTQLDKNLQFLARWCVILQDSCRILARAVHKGYLSRRKKFMHSNCSTAVKYRIYRTIAIMHACPGQHYPLVILKRLLIASCWIVKSIRVVSGVIVRKTGSQPRCNKALRFDVVTCRV